MRPSWSSHNSERPGNSRRGAVRLLLVASLLFFFGWELVSTLRPAVQAQGRARGRKLRVKDRSLAGRLDRLGGRRVADYGGYLLYEVPESAAQELIGHSSVEAVDEYRFVLLNGGPIDTETSSSAHPGRAAPESFDGKRLRIVQFVGPSRPEWVTALRDTGAELVSYIPHNAYLVYADAASMGALTELESSDRVIQWQAPYQRGHKVHPGAFRAAQLRALRRQRRSRSAAAQDEDLYAVQLVNDPAANAVTIGMVSAISSGAIRSQFRVRDYLNIIVPLELGDLDAVAARPDVVSIHPFAVPEKSGERQGQIMAFDLTGTTSGYLDFLAASGFTQQQFTASGFAVDISDSGIDNATTSPNHPGLYIGGNTSAASRVLYNRLEGSPIFGNTLEGCDGHGNINAHILAGYNDGFGFPFADADGFRFGLGVAPFVKVRSSVIFAPDYTYPDFPDLQSRAYADGARISSNSWGGLVYGAYDVTAQTFDALVRDAQPSGAAVASPGNQEMVIIVAAGNEGFEGLRSPATAKNVITVGASENIHFLGDADGCGLDDSAADNADDMADFSSRGPTEDGRIKPDLVAPGTHVSGGVYQSATPGATGEANACFDGSGNCGLATGFFFPAGQQFYTISSGTSHATPAVAASAALVRQFFINQGLVPPSPAMTKAFLMSSARYLTGAGANDTLWSNSQGMGAVNLGAAFDTPPRLLYDQRPEEMFTASGQNFTVTGTIAEPSRPFRVTLAWTDAPGSTTGPAFNNDLDLTVTVGGQVYKGNVFSGALSTTGGAADMRNNVESVHLPAGTIGDFTVSVSASNINSDGVPNIGGNLDQDFALVVENGDEIPRPAIVAAGATLIAEECGVGNGVLDPGESVTVDLGLANLGLLDTSELIATLEASGGVASPSGPQSYGELQVGAPAVSRSFSFVAEGVCGGDVTATLSLEDGGVDIGSVQFVFDLGLQAPSGAETILSNPSSLSIPIGGPAIPYPSSIEVSGLTGQVSNVRVTLFGVSHAFPDDIDVLLVAPDGRGVVLMSDAGGGNALQSVELTFDDSAGASLSDGGPIATGTYKPTNYEGQSDEFVAPAPSGPYASALGELSGVDPNGSWSLYVTDDFFLDGGSIADGWSLTFERTVPVCCGGGPGFLVSPGEVTTTEGGGTATFTVALTSTPSAEVTIGLESSDPTEGVVSPSELVFSTTDAQLPKSVTVTGIDDTLVDGDVAFTILTLPAASTDSDYDGFDPPDVAVVNINDDLTSLAIGDVSLVEGDTGTKSFVFAVTLTAPSEVEVSVGFATQDDAATAGSDYEAATGTLVFSPGMLSQTIPVAVTGDTAVEDDESFFVDLSGAVGADVLDGRGIGTILNDDAPTLSVSTTAVAMGESVQVTVADGPGDRSDWVSLAEVGSAANSYLDWQYLNGTRSIPATGQMSAELAFTMPLTPGEYELRFFMNSYNLLATSPVVTVKPPSLTVSATTVAPGGSVQVSVAEGPGQRGDWVALAAVGSGLASYVDWNYLSGTRSMPATGVTSAVLTFDMPETGAYELRFFANNGYTLLATSPVVTVELPSIPVLEVVPASLSFGTVETDASADRSVTVRNAGAGTLVGEATAVGAGFSLVGNTSYALGADETALLTVRFAPVSAGAASGALSLTGAGGATVPLSGIGELPSTTPLLEVDPQTLSFGSVAPGSNADLSITVRNAGAGILAGEATVTGPGFLLVGVTNYSLGAGETTSLTVRFAPPAAGEAIGMLSLTGAGGATVPLSGTGTVGPTVAVSATSVALGGSVEVTVLNGPGNRGDSVSLAEVGSAANSYLDWQYLNGTRSIPATGQMSVELTFIMPLTPGEYELRFFMNSYNLLATSPVVTVKPPTLTVSATTVAPGGSVQLSVAEGPGQRGDWVALAAVGSGLASYVDWNYLSGARSMPATGVTSAVLTFDMPETGAYEFRFFANNGYTLLATSPVVTVELPSTLVSEVPAAESGP